VDGWTPTQRRIINLLADGLPHARGELRRCLHDELGDESNVRFHIHRIRRQLPSHEAIVCEIWRGRITYRHVRLLTAPVP
jgi:hypothetical protein